MKNLNAFLSDLSPRSIFLKVILTFIFIDVAGWSVASQLDVIFPVEMGFLAKLVQQNGLIPLIAIMPQFADILSKWFVGSALVASPIVIGLFVWLTKDRIDWKVVFNLTVVFVFSLVVATVFVSVVVQIFWVWVVSDIGKSLVEVGYIPSSLSGLQAVKFAFFPAFSVALRMTIREFRTTVLRRRVMMRRMTFRQF